jgi:cytoskeletal protein RodZ
MPEHKGDRSIRNIPIPGGHHHRRPAAAYVEEYSEPPRRRRGRRRRLWLVLGAVIVVCAVAGVLLSTVFEGASVVVSPKTAQVTAPQSITASLNPPAGGLAYQVVTTSRTASTSVPANGSEQVSRAASGVITVYNNYSTASQQLITNTRFETSDGKIYRIHQAVTVPGAKKNADNTLSPGSVAVTAYADAPGSDYNTGAAQFAIPGFKGDPRYSSFYAKTDGMTGGFVGTEPAVASSTLAQVTAALKNGLQSALQNAAASDLPAQFLPIPGTLQVSYANVEETPNQDGSVTLSQTAQAAADVVRAGDLAAVIAKQTVDGYAGEAVNFADPSQIAIALAAGSSPGQGSLTLSLQGQPTLVWQFDTATLKAALVGKPKGQFQTILASFEPAIDCTNTAPCTASIRPFWQGSFPSNPDKISVTVAPVQ